MSEAKDDYSGGDKINATELNKISENANDAGGFRDDKNAGETIAGATLPVPVYQNTTDNEFYKCDANDTDKLNFVGFAISNSTDGNPIDIQMTGIVRGFSGLEEGTKYYVQDTVGTIGTTPGTEGIFVGIAISETEIVMNNISEKVFNTLYASASDILRYSLDEVRLHSGAIMTKLKSIRVAYNGIYKVKYDGSPLASGGVISAYIAVNGVDVGGTLLSNDTSYVNTEFTTGNLNAGDTIEIWAYNTSNNIAYIRNLRLYFDRNFVEENGSTVFDADA